MPGGAIEGTETVQQASVREVEEETGIRKNHILNNRLFKIDQANQQYVYVIFVASMVERNLDPSKDPDKEFTDLVFFPFDELPVNTFEDAKTYICGFKTSTS